MTRNRRDERIIDFTPDALAALPPAKGYSDLWYDRQSDNLAYRKMGNYRGAIEGYVVLAGRQIRRGAELNGVHVKRFNALPSTLSVEEARAKAKELAKSFEAYHIVGKKKRNGKGGAFLPTPGVVATPESILHNQGDPNAEGNYDKLLSILMDAFDQASKGKGVERHGNGLNFEDQDMLKTMDRVGIGFALGQAIKKITEGSRMRRTKAKQEFLGAIVYLAGAILWASQNS